MCNAPSTIPGPPPRRPPTRPQPPAEPPKRLWKRRHEPPARQPHRTSPGPAAATRRPRGRHPGRPPREIERTSAERIWAGPDLGAANHHAHSQPPLPMQQRRTSHRSLPGPPPRRPSAGEPDDAVPVGSAFCLRPDRRRRTPATFGSRARRRGKGRRQRRRGRRPVERVWVGGGEPPGVAWVRHGRELSRASSFQLNLSLSN